MVQPANDIRVEVLPGNATVAKGGYQSFTAKVTGTDNPGVTWSVEEGAPGGVITQGGTYAAPQTPGTYTVVATSVADPSKSGTATVTVQPAPVVVTVTPAFALTQPNGTVQFSASAPSTTSSTSRRLRTASSP